MPRLEVLRRDPPDARTTPLLFVHGAWHGAWCWEDRFLDWFAARGFRVLAPSLRGHGNSGPFSRWNRLRDYAEDVREVAATCEQPPVLIGHSMGAYVVQHALTRPGAGCAGILVCPPPAGGVLATALAVLRRYPVRFLMMNLTLRLGPLVSSPTVTRELFLRQDAPEDVVQALYQRLHDESYLAFLDMIALDRPRPSEIDVPVRVIGAERDTIFSVAEVSTTAERYDTTPIIVEGAAHDLMLDEDWEAAAQHIDRWAHELSPT